MKQVTFIFLFILFGVFLVGCGAPEVVDAEVIVEPVDIPEANPEFKCSPPYIQKGIDCCLDQDTNNICDEDEVEEPAPLVPKVMTYNPQDALNSVVVIKTKERLGSGFFIDKEYIITNMHVAWEQIAYFEKFLEVKDRKGKTYPATVIGYNLDNDFAVLRLIDDKGNPVNKNWPSLKFGKSAKAKVGDVVFALGSPSGYEQSVSKGIISAKRRASYLNEDKKTFIQTDAAVNPGNSGGPLIDSENKVIGMNTFAVWNTEGINFALESDTMKKLYKLITSQKCDYLSCYETEWKDADYKKLQIGEPDAVKFFWTETREQVSFTSITLSIDNKESLSKNVCSRIRIIQGDEILYDEAGERVEFSGNGKKKVEYRIDKYYKSPGKSFAYYFDVVLTDCDSDEERYYFAGMHDFNKFEPRVILPSDYQ